MGNRLLQGRNQLGHTLTGGRSHRDDRRGLEPGPEETLLDLQNDEIPGFGANPVDLGQCDHGPIHPEEVEHRQMLLGLGLPPLIRRHHQQPDIDPAGTGQHVLHKPVMTGDVDERDLAPARKGHPGKTEVDGETTPLLLLQPIGVASRSTR